MIIDKDLEKRIVIWKNNHLRTSWKYLPKDYYDYLIQRFADTQDLRECVYRLKHNITEIPKCPICGEKRFFYGNYYAKTCKKRECENKNRQISIEQTFLEKYGVKNCWSNPEVRKKMKTTMIEKYGDENFNNREKQKQTCIARYGVDSYTKTDECKQKIKEIFNEKYGADNIFSSEYGINKIKQTCIERYGVDSYTKTDECKQKIKNTKLNRYGDEHFVNPEKTKQTCLEKYGVTNPMKTGFVKEKIKQTCLEKYGVDHNWKIPEEHLKTCTPEALEKKRQTCLKNYGVDNYSKTDEWKKDINKQWKNILILELQKLN